MTTEQYELLYSIAANMHEAEANMPMSRRKNDVTLYPTSVSDRNKLIYLDAIRATLIQASGGAA